jgi:hypothetical protein
MASISDNRKKRGRGRPPTGIGKPVGLRLYRDLEQRVDTWAKRQTDKPGRPEAIRRLLEQALAVATLTGQGKAGSERSTGLATKPKRRLIKGPHEFRDVRGDQPKKKG